MGAGDLKASASMTSRQDDRPNQEQRLIFPLSISMTLRSVGIAR